MPQPKRQRSSASSAAGSTASKKPKTTTGDSSAASTQLPAGMEGSIDITVKIDSKRKAERNDPAPPRSKDDVMREAKQDYEQCQLEAAQRNQTSGTSPANAPPPRTGQPSTEAGVAGAADENESGSEDSSESDGDDGMDYIMEYDNSQDDGEQHSEDESDGDDGFSWLEFIGATAKRGDKTIGSCAAQLIRRGRFRETFWQSLEEPNKEVADLAFTLFDRYGRLNPEHYKHEFRKGTGAWGQELDDGDLLFFDYIRVDREWRRHGVARQMVNAILEKTRGKVRHKAGPTKDLGFTAVASPGVLNSDQGEEEDCPTFFAREMPIALSFWRAKTLPSEEVQHVFNNVNDATIDDTQCHDFVKAAFSEDRDDQLWLSTDKAGNTLLHLAAMRSRVALVKGLLAIVPHLSSVRNHQGCTPVEALQKVLEHQRTRLEWGVWRMTVMSDEFSGFDKQSTACLSMLQGMEPVDLSSLSVQVLQAVSSNMAERLPINFQPPIDKIRQTLVLKYGCTCGECLGGFLSPRMKHQLLRQAETECDNLKEGAENLDGETFVDLYNNGHLLTFLPRHVRMNMKTNKGMRQGFANMFGHIALCLRTNAIPWEDHVHKARQARNEWPPVTKTYLDRGGSVAAVANMLFQLAMDADEFAGDGSHRDFFGDEIDNLPACRNDHEFGFVSGMCGYQRMVQNNGRMLGNFGRDWDD
ncbi:hypothetical protein GE09DRAFT_1284130 [Coniochaeta sp. 2T2.1]|nr:hypothetical protein GE09DRAFT_1284130 [Coniochaeta sp. 2T2.1]